MHLMYLIAILGVLMIGGALYAVFTKNVLFAVISSGIISLNASIIYLMLAAPDVAMTEAAIGSALTTIVFLYVLARIKKEGGSLDD